MTNTRCAGGEKSRFKIMAEQDVLEDFDLNELSRGAISAAHEMKTQSPPHKFPAVTVIIQEPCIAIRFPLQYGQIRRFQMKFKLGSDFYKALAFFSQAGCPFTQAGSLGSQTQSIPTLSSSSTVSQSGNRGQIEEGVGSSSSTADSDRRTPLLSLGSSLYSSSRPSTSSSRTWMSNAGASSSSTVAHDTDRGRPLSEKPSISPFFSEPNLELTMLNTIGEDHNRYNYAQLETQKVSPFPLSVSVTAFAGQPSSSAQETSSPALLQLTPRPSTAPHLEIPRLSQMLPPKRELPFKVPRSGAEKSCRITKNGPAERSVKGKTVANLVTNDLRTSQEAETGDAQAISGRARRPPTKPSRRCTRGSRNNMVMTRSRKKSSLCKEDSPVPTVEELLGLSRELSEEQDKTNTGRGDTTNGPPKPVAPEANASKDKLETELAADLSTGHVKQSRICPTSPQHNDIDTQAQLSRIDERQRVKITKQKENVDFDEGETALRPSKRVTADTGLNLAALPHHGRSARFGREGLQDPPIARSIVRDADLRDVSFTPMTADANIACGHELEGNHKIPPSAQKPIEGISARATSKEDTTPPERHPLANMSDAAQPGRPLNLGSRSLMALMNDPDFAKSPDIVEWADLPSEERKAALETWMCQQLESEGFAILLKTLEGMWQRIFLGC